MATPKVSVIIPCRNEAEYIGRMVQSALDSIPPMGGMELIAVDGMSEDGTRIILDDFQKKHPDQVRVLTNPKRVVSHGLNVGIGAARGEIIVRLDAHAYYQRDYIAQCVQWLERTGADNVGGTLLVEPSEDTAISRAIARSIAHPFGSGNATHKTTLLEEPRYVDTVAFGCFRRSLFDRIGYFREDLARSQDMEFNIRLRRSGGKILLVPQIKSYYQARSKLSRIIPYYLSNGFWVLFPLKFGVRAFQLRHLVPLFFVTWIALAAIGALWFSWAKAALLMAVAAYFIAALAASVQIAIRERRIEYLVTMPPAFALLHVLNGVGTAYGGLCLLLEWLLPQGVFEKETPTHRV